MGNKSTDKTEKTEKTEAFTVKKLAEWISIKKIAVAVGFAFFASMVPNWLLAFIARPFGGRLRIFCSKPSDVASYAFCDRSAPDRSGNNKADVPGLEWRLVQCFYIYADAGGLCIQKFLDRTCVLDAGNDCSHLLYGT